MVSKVEIFSLRKKNQLNSECSNKYVDGFGVIIIELFEMLNNS